MPRKAQASGHGGKVDNAAGAVGGEIGQRGLHEQNGSEDIDVVLPVETLGGDFFQGEVPRDARVVDDDVDLEFAASGVREVVLGCVYDVGWSIGVAHVGLDAEDGDAVGLLELRG